MPTDVEGERMGLSPLAVSELAKEFRRLAAEAERQAVSYPTWGDDAGLFELQERARVWTQAAQMLEERLDPPKMTR